MDPACFEWSQGVASFGRRFSIRVNDPQLFGILPDLLPPLSVASAATSFDRSFSLRRPGPCPCGAEHEHASLFGGRQELYRGADIDSAGRQLRTALKLDVAELARRRVFLHAGAVVWNGVGIVIPGGTMGGKTTLVGEFLRAGALYYSDEYAVLDRLGQLHPYPQPLGVRDGRTSVQHDRPASSFAASTATAPARISFVVLTRYVRGARWDPETLSVGHTMMGMLEHAVAARRYPQRVLSTLHLVASGAVGWSGERGDARQTVAAIGRRIGSV